MVERPCPKELREALAVFAKAVKKFSDLEALRSLEPQIEYHLAEYLSEMEGMLTMQLVTALPSVDERLRLLRQAGLDYLEMNVLVVTDLLQNEDE